MNKRERLEKTIAGEATDRVPVALWRHWPGDDQRAADFAKSTVEFQRTYDWDFVKVTPASNYEVIDYGVQDEWQGNVEGTRTCVKRVIRRSLDWTELRPLEPSRGELGKNLDALGLITTAVPEVPVIQTIFNPLSQAKKLGGQEKLLHDMRVNPDRLHTALNILTESILRYIDVLKRTYISGIFYAVQHASYQIMSEEEYRIFGLPYDRKILESLPEKWWLNVLHLHGDAPMFRLCAEYPVQVINWHAGEAEPDLTQGKALFKGAVCGGLSQWNHLHGASPATIRNVAREAMTKTTNRRFILSTGCVALATSPLSNLRATRESVETVSA